MFQVKFYVDNRKLGDALERLGGVALGIPEAVPVHGAKATKNGHIKSTQPVPGASLPAQVAKVIMDGKYTMLNRYQLDEIIAGAGGSKASRSYVATELRRSYKLLGHYKKGAGYPVKGVKRNV